MRGMQACRRQLAGLFGNLAGNADNKVKIEFEEGIEELIRAMKTHEGHEDVQEAGCRALLVFAGDSAVMHKLHGLLTCLQRAYSRHKSESAKRLIDRLML